MLCEGGTERGKAVVNFQTPRGGRALLGVSGGPHRSRGRTSRRQNASCSSPWSRGDRGPSQERLGVVPRASRGCPFWATKASSRNVRPTIIVLARSSPRFGRINSRPASLQWLRRRARRRAKHSAHARGRVLSHQQTWLTSSRCSATCLPSRARSRRRCVPRRRRVFRRAPRPWSSRLGMTWSGTRAHRPRDP